MSPETTYALPSCKCARAPMGSAKRRRDDRAPFGIPPPPLGPAVLPGTPGPAHTRDRGFRTWQKMLCPAARNRKEALFAVARPRPMAPDARVQTERAAWEDTRIAPGCPPGIASPGRWRAFEIPKGRLRAPAQRL